MSAIIKFRERGYKLITKEQEIIFSDSTGCSIFFYLDREEIGTSILYTSDSKELTKIIKLFQKELGWNEIKTIKRW